MAREFDGDEDMVAYGDSLDERWPERFEIRKYIVGRLSDLGCTQSTIVELCSGDGRLAKEILDAVPDANYVGVDASRSLCGYVHRSLSVQTVCADLSDPGWTASLDCRPNAIVTLQSMHDVGDGDVIRQLYQSSFDLLSPGGILLAADFVVEEDGFDPDRPGRLPVSWHLSELAASGFSNVSCAQQSGAIACFSAERPPE